MLFDYMRILKSIAGTLSDLSYDNQDDTALPVLNLASTDYVLLGMQYPFNNFFINQTGGVVNDQASVLGLQYWDGSKWVDVVDLMDGTALAGCTLAKSGHILFSPNKQKTGWGKVNNPRVQGPPELATKDIYDLYWLKVKVSADLKATTSFQELGFAWTTGQKLKGVKSEVDRYLPSFATGKTNWIPEIMLACKMMATDLKKMGVALGPQQVLRVDDFWLPATYKTLSLIYGNLGPAYADTAKEMRESFYKTMNVPNLTTDQDHDGDVSGGEINSSGYYEAQR
jgi:hypothetical protein